MSTMISASSAGNEGRSCGNEDNGCGGDFDYDEDIVEIVLEGEDELVLEQEEDNSGEIRPMGNGVGSSGVTADENGGTAATALALAADEARRPLGCEEDEEAGDFDDDEDIVEIVLEGEDELVLEQDEENSGEIRSMGNADGGGVTADENGGIAATALAVAATARVDEADRRPLGCEEDEEAGGEHVNQDVETVGVKESILPPPLDVGGGGLTADENGTSAAPAPALTAAARDDEAARRPLGCEEDEAGGEDDQDLAVVGVTEPILPPPSAVGPAIVPTSPNKSQSLVDPAAADPAWLYSYAAFAAANERKEAGGAAAATPVIITTASAATVRTDLTSRHSAAAAPLEVDPAPVTPTSASGGLSPVCSPPASPVVPPFPSLSPSPSCLGAAAGTSSSSSGLPSRPVAEFLSRLTRMLTDRSIRNLIEWTPQGSIRVHDPHALENEVLGKYFRHSKYSSFQRQLYYFGFRKQLYYFGFRKVGSERGQMSPCSFINDDVGDDLSSLLSIKRRAANRARGRKARAEKEAAAKAVDDPTTVAIPTDDGADDPTSSVEELAKWCRAEAMKAAARAAAGHSAVSAKPRNRRRCMRCGLLREGEDHHLTMGRTSREYCTVPIDKRCPFWEVPAGYEIDDTRKKAHRVTVLTAWKRRKQSLGLPLHEEYFPNW